jgi:hypothetical protein
VIEFAVAVVGIGFVAAQGGAVFITAWLARRFLKLNSNWWKPLLMLVSYFSWIILTGIYYQMRGGGWGMMDGGLFMFGLFGAAALSSVVYAILWQVVPMIGRRKANA